MRVICIADNSHEISVLYFCDKKKKEVSSAVVLISALRVQGFIY